MNLVAKIMPLPFIQEEETGAIYRKLELVMQQMGHLVSYREALNWNSHVDDIELGNREGLQSLKKTAARNDQVPLFIAKWFKKTVYQHIIIHPNDQGYYLPFRFDEPFYIKIDGENIWFGSAIKLLEECKWLEITMEQKEKSEVGYQFWSKLKQACEKSIETQTPIAFSTGE